MSQPPILSATSSSDISSTCQTFSLTPQEFSSLRDQAVAAKSLSYSPYSKFRVGAVLLTTSGQYIQGANIENASYPVTTCAERVAIGKALTTPGSQGPFKAIAVATDISSPVSPCGMCRQCIKEFCEPEMPVIMFDGEGKFSVMKLGELLPLSFGPEHLDKPRQG